MDGCRVKVSKLRLETTNEDIQELFSPYGELKILNRTVEGQSLTVEVRLKDEVTASRAVEELRRKPWKGQLFRIDIDRRRGPGQPPP